MFATGVRGAGLAAAMLLALTGGATAQAPARGPATGAVALDQPGPVIAPEVYGHFMEQLGSGIDGGVWVGPDSDIPNIRGYRRDVVEALQALEVPVVRWPGGCYADIYHWRDGIGPREARPVRLNHWWGGTEEAHAFGTHEFFEFAELIGAKTYLSLNVGSGTVAESMAWVEYITSPSRSTLANERRANGREAPWTIDYLGIGNEPWGCGGRMRPEYYADLLRHYVGFVTGGGQDPVVVAAGPAADDGEWTRVLMTADDHFDALALHYYTLPTGDWTTKGPAIGFGEDQWRSAFRQTYLMESHLRLHDGLMDVADPAGEKILAVDEWGAWYDPTPGTLPGALQQQNSLRDGLVAAVNFHIFHRHADRVRLANVAQMVNVLQSVLLTDGPRMVRTPTYHAFHMYRPFKGAQTLPVRLEAPAYDDLPSVDVTAALREDGEVVLAFVHLDPGAPREVTLTLPGLGPRRISAEALTAGALDAYNTFDAPDRVRPAPFTGVKRDGDALGLRLPARSVVVVRLAPA